LNLPAALVLGIPPIVANHSNCLKEKDLWEPVVAGFQLALSKNTQMSFSLFEEMGLKPNGWIYKYC